MKEARANAVGRSVAIALAVLLPAAMLAWGGYTRRWIGDDGFINLRVVNQLLAGNGFVFNAGERSEAVTSPGWVGLLWLAGSLGARLEDAAWQIGLVLSVLGLGLTCVAALSGQADPARSRRWFLPFGSLAYACLPPAWDYATSGLENGLGLAFLGSCACLTVRALRPSAPRSAAAAAAFVLSFAPLVRPDYELLAAPLLGLLCLHASGLRRRLELAGLGVSAGVAYEIFRMGYFGSVVPNTAFAKQAFETRWLQGWHYLWNSVGLYWLLVPLGGLVLVLVSRLQARTQSASAGETPLSLPLCLVCGGLLHLSYIVAVGGDFMHARLLMPGLFALFSAVPVVALDAPLSTPKRIFSYAACALTFAWCAVCAAGLRVAAENEFGIGDERGWYASMAEVENPTRIEDYAEFAFYRDAVRLRRLLKKHCGAMLPAPATGVARSCPPVLLTRTGDGVLRDHEPAAMLELAPDSAPPGVAAVISTRPLGIAGAVLGLRFNLIDYYGLADPVAARLTLALRRRPGHEKSFDTVWQAARYAAPESTADERVLAARHALGCGMLAELTRATREPLSVRRFLGNLTLAIRSRGMRIPHDHLEAEATFCPDLIASR